ncbi:hypothetical protein GCM10027425_25120 [Alteromonas gracilis]
MELTSIVPVLAGAVALATFAVIVRTSGASVRHWWLPAVPLAFFLGWSVAAIVVEGPGGFWPEHVGTLWEVQIWMDLLLMASAAWWLAQPRLRATGSSPWPWLVLVLATGAIGMLSLLLWIRRAEARQSARQPLPA